MSRRTDNAAGTNEGQGQAAEELFPLVYEELLALDEALDRLAEVEPRAAEVVKLRFFVDLTQEQAARELSVSVSTIERTWAFTRVWLFRALQKQRNSLR
jgi:DNA-directed RNA polymerase specialized sigma24 family protein